MFLINKTNISKYAYYIISFFNEFYFVENGEKKYLLLKFGKNLRKLRESKNFTQAQLAHELNVEISQISRIERGLINTSVITVYNIANVLKVSISDLFELE